MCFVWSGGSGPGLRNVEGFLRKKGEVVRDEGGEGYSRI